jgi:excisionase family DNA binding protein
MSTEEQVTGNGALLRIREAAAILKVSTRTVWRMIAEGQLTVVRVRRCTRLLLSQVNGLCGGSDV